MSSCKVENCGKTVLARGYCESHYKRFRRYGDPLRYGPVRGKTARFILTALEYQGDDCLIWPYGRSAKGYGLARFGGKSGHAHRHVCEAVHGRAQEGMEARHLCGNGFGGCVNPKHLVWSTHQENMDDKWKHGTVLQGERHPGAKLTEADVTEIRWLLDEGITQKRIADLYKVDQSNISYIKTGRYWASLGV